MTPKEKAQELVNKHFDFVEAWSESNQLENAKKCALITADEMLEYENRMINEWTKYFEGKGGQMKIERLFWNEVKTEIKKITL